MDESKLMINRVTKIALVAFVALFTTQIFANNISSINQLQRYLLSKQFIQAYEYSESLTDELAGELEFDFLAGVAAFSAGKYQKAIFAFERVVIMNPASLDGRYYLALSYLKVDNLHAAKLEFERLIANSSSVPALKSKAEIQLNRTNKILANRNASWSHEIGLKMGSDSNVNSGSSQDEIILADGTLIPLFDSSKVLADNTFSAQYRGKYSYAMNQFQKLSANFSVNEERYFEHSEYNRQLLSLSLRYEHQLLNEASWYVGLTTSPMEFLGERYRTQNALSFGWRQPINKTNSFGFNGSLSDINYFVYEQLDLERYQMGAFYRIQTQYQHTFLLSWYQDENNQGLTYNNRNATGASYILSYPIANHFFASGMLRYEEQNYQAPNPVFNAYSDSSLAILSTELVYSGFDKQRLHLKLNFQDKKIESELAAMKIYEYDRLEISFTWKYTL